MKQATSTESVNGKFRNKCPSMEWFRSRSEAEAIVETWERHCNEDRPHSSLGYLTPHELTKRSEQSAGTHAGAAILWFPVVRGIQAGHHQLQVHVPAGHRGPRHPRRRRPVRVRRTPITQVAVQ